MTDASLARHASVTQSSNVRDCQNLPLITDSPGTLCWDEIWERGAHAKSCPNASSLSSYSMAYLRTAFFLLAYETHQ